MKLLIPIILVLVGLFGGVGAGLALKKEPEKNEAHAAACDEHSSSDDCAADPFDTHADASDKGGSHGDEAHGKPTYVPMDKPFVVPVFAKEKVSSMVVVSLSVETGEEEVETINSYQPRLRDRFLKVMFMHANSGGFDGSFTNGRKLEDLKTALLRAARDVVSNATVMDVLITEIARQDT